MGEVTKIQGGLYMRPAFETLLNDPTLKAFYKKLLAFKSNLDKGHADLKEEAEQLKEVLERFRKCPCHYYKQVGRFQSWNSYLEPVDHLERRLEHFSQCGCQDNDEELVQAIEKALPFLKHELMPTKGYYAQVGAWMWGSKPPLVEFYDKVLYGVETDVDFEQILTLYPELKGIEQLETPEAMGDFLFGIVHPYVMPDDSAQTLEFWKGASELLEERGMTLDNPSKEIGEASVSFAKKIDRDPSKSFDEERDLFTENLSLIVAQTMIENTFGTGELLSAEKRGILLSLKDPKEKQAAFHEALTEAIDCSKIGTSTRIGAKIYAYFMPLIVHFAFSRMIPQAIEAMLSILPKEEDPNLSLQPIHEINKILESILNEEDIELKSEKVSAFIASWIVPGSSFLQRWTLWFLARAGLIEAVIEKTTETISNTTVIDECLYDILNEQQAAIKTIHPVVEPLPSVEGPAPQEESVAAFQDLVQNLLSLVDTVADLLNTMAKNPDRLIVQKGGEALSIGYQKLATQENVQSMLHQAFASSNKLFCVPNPYSGLSIEDLREATSGKVEELIDELIDHHTQEYALSESERLQKLIDSIGNTFDTLKTIRKHVDASEWHPAEKDFLHLLSRLSKDLERLRGYEEKNFKVRKGYRLVERLLPYLETLSDALAEREEAKTLKALAELDGLGKHVAYRLEEMETGHVVKGSWAQTALRWIPLDHLPIVGDNLDAAKARAVSLTRLHRDPHLVRGLLHRVVMLPVHSAAG